MEGFSKSMEDIIREERNRTARAWRANNKDKNKAIQDRYWFNRAMRRANGEFDVKEDMKC